MENHTLQAGFPARFIAPYGVFPLRYSDTALETVRHLGLDMTYLPFQLNTRRAELVEINWDDDTAEYLHYRVQFGHREVILVINPFFRWRVMKILEVDG